MLFSKVTDYTTTGSMATSSGMMYIRQTILHITSHKVEYIFESNKQNDKIRLWKLSLLAIATIYNLNYSKNQRVRTTIFPSQPGNVLNIY